MSDEDPLKEIQFFRGIAAAQVAFVRIDPAISEQLDRIEAMLREVQQQIYDATGISDAAREHWKRLERRDE